MWETELVLQLSKTIGFFFMDLRNVILGVEDRRRKGCSWYSLVTMCLWIWGF